MSGCGVWGSVLMRNFTQEEYRLAANVIRGLSIDAIQKANSGHPGLPLGMADVAAVLWLRYLKTCPRFSKWPSRDRFVLSGGHGSAMLYSLLHLAGYKVSLDDLRNFRQLGSCTPGHPELGVTDGVEATTGPLGQGLANAVGMAAAERMLAARFNKPDAPLFDNQTYVFCGDGDMMEGISHEAASLAGHLKLSKLTVFYDSNDITIEGAAGLASSDNTAERFKAYGWKTLSVDGHDYGQIDSAIRRALKSDAPTLIICRTVIGWGSPNKAGSAKAHGEPLGEEEKRLTKRALGLPEDADFYVPDAVRKMFAARNSSMARLCSKWKRMFKEQVSGNPEMAAKWEAFFGGGVPEGLFSESPVFDKPCATRAASGACIQAAALRMPCLVGGSADLAPSNKSWIEDGGTVSSDDFSGRNFHFGIRELGMCAVQNGMIIYGGLRVFSATFFVFSDYMRPAIRVAALSGIPAIYVFSHDSFYVGEDGPTHEPVEQLAALRAMPNVTVIRPADPTETPAAWLAALRNTSGPTAILVTRQTLPLIDRNAYPPASMLEKGAYVLWQRVGGVPDVIVIASGSETVTALKAAQSVGDLNVRVVNMPSWELFEKQPEEYRFSVLDPRCRRRVVVEAGSSFGWERYAGAGAKMITLDTYGASAPYSELERKYGFTVDNVAAVIRRSTAV